MYVRKEAHVIKVLITICFFFIWNECKAQSLIYQKCLGGSLEDYGTGIRETSDYGFVLCGQVESLDGDIFCSYGNGDGWLVKLDSSFNIQWQKCIGGTSGERLDCIDVTNDGGFILGGATASIDGVVNCNSHGSLDYWVIKTDGSGNIQWQNCYGGSAIDDISDIHQTLDGGYILAGNTHSNDGDVIGSHSGNGGDPDYWIVKLDSIGNIEWSKAFGGVGYEFCYSIVETDDQHFVACGIASYNNGDVSGIHGSFDYWVIKIDSLGNLLWQKALGGSSSDAANDLVATSGGGVLVMGEASSNDGDVGLNRGSWDTWVVQLDQNGNIVWQKSYGGSGYDSGRCMTKSLDGGFMLLSLGDSNDGDANCSHGADFWFTKIDSIGNFEFQQCLGGSDIDKPHRVISTTDSGYAAIGLTHSNNGDVSGYHGTCTTHSCYDFWVVKIGSTTSGISEIDEKNKSLQLAYNTFENKLKIHWNSNYFEKSLVQIFDITGRILFSKTIDSSPGENNFATPLEIRGSQILFTRLLGSYSAYTGRIVVVND